MPDRIGFLFPGQGSQAVGMGKDLCETYPAAKALFEQASQILGYNLTDICIHGPEDKLTRTLYAQPAIFTVSMAVLRVLREKFPDMNPSFYAGLSLGEFSALCAAGAIPFEDALRLVQKRAEAMERSAEHHPGTMASVMGLSAADCEAVAKEAGCEVANLNSPDQTVLSGTVETIEKACKLAEAKGAKRAIVLKVGGAFHSTLMREAKEDLEKALKVTRVQAPKGTFIPNATAQKTSNPDDIRTLLAKQLMSPVRWVETMNRAAEEGISLYLEIGPGKVLKGLARKCQPQLSVEPCGTVADIEKLQTLFAQI
jgi:[acyl-carrier-protein] S-malonyltransferase